MISPLNDIFTDKATAGVIPPPADTAPGCGAPCGGNIFMGGGAIAAAAAVTDVATAACSAVVNSSEMNSSETKNEKFINRNSKNQKKMINLHEIYFI